MQYNQLENAVNYFKNLYQGAYQIAYNIAQKIGDSLMPSPLELAVAGVPNPIMDVKPTAPDKSQGYLFAEYTVASYAHKYTPGGGTVVVVTRSDGHILIPK